jgi:eukaryotic-like serine/threonine-protein kinase
MRAGDGTGTEGPKSVGRYQIRRWLTSGAMGEIYEALDPVIDRRVAIKIVRRDLNQGDDALVWLDRFRQEVRAAGRLLHPNIVTVLDCGEDSGAPFLAMEYIEGESVARILKRSGRLVFQDAISIITQTLDALECAHANGVIHRDIKPSNILVTKTGLVKLADFGIAHLEASELTGAGVALGTPSYMAPEQFAANPVDHRADLFSAGAVLFELLSGVKPFRGRSVAENMLNMEQRVPTDLCQLNPEVSPELRQVIEVALAFEPQHRYRNAAEFSRAIGTASLKPAATILSTAGEETKLATAAPTPSTSAPVETAGTPLLGPELLREIERDLATFVGPWAGFAVRRSARTMPDIKTLYEELAAYILVPEERASFIAMGQRRAAGLVSRVSAYGTGSLPRPTVSGRDPLALAADQISRIENTLTRYIGPIARIVLRQQLSRSASLADFYRDLAAHIPDERDRTDFLRSHLGSE